MNGKTKWTIMVYIGADENLANFAIESLKQLRRSASPDVVVAAQLDLDGPNHPRELRRYIFDGSNRSEPLSVNNERCWTSDEQRSLVMTEPTTLTAFVDWVYGCQRCNDPEHYCLILWGHGPQLLFEAPATAEAVVNNGDSRATDPLSSNGAQVETREKPRKLYFTPVQLRQALKETELVKQRKIDIIALDACSMSTIEFAYELRHLADFMVASQEDVPQFSFPYTTLVDQFRDATSPKDLGQRSVLDYAQAYEEHVCIPHAGTKKVTLSCLDLEKINMIAGPLRNLALALNAGARFKSVSDAIFAARKNAKAFVGGLFVDIHSFCEQLLGQLSVDNIPVEGRESLWAACEAVCNAIATPQAEDACIIANHTVDERCHGLSVYFPYMQNEQQGEQPRAQDRKGGRDTIGKGGMEVPSKGGMEVPSKGGMEVPSKGGLNLPSKGNIDLLSKGIAARYGLSPASAESIRRAVLHEMIRDTEGYYKSDEFEFTGKTGWYEFIAGQWSRILVEREPEDLDLRYSAHQCALNLLPRGQRADAEHDDEEARVAEAVAN